MSGKPFCVSYTNKKTGTRIENERPRLMLTVDGAHKSLFLGDAVLVSVRVNESDETLWKAARVAIASM